MSFQNTLAILDLGTNTFNLLVAAIGEKGDFKILADEKEAVKIGLGGISKKVITEEAIVRAIKAIAKHRATAESFGATQFIAIGTSALRNASNSSAFIERIKAEYDISIHVIDGEREAALIFEGIQLSGISMEENSLIVDIGGGSVEFIIAGRSGILWKKSIEIGVARILEFVPVSERLEHSHIEMLHHFFDEKTAALSEAAIRFPFTKMIGSAGAFETFVEMHIYPERLNLMNEIHRVYQFSEGEFESVYQRLIASSLEERLATPSIPSFRADSIVIAAVLVKYLLDKYQLKQVSMSTFSLKEGVLAENSISMR